MVTYRGGNYCCILCAGLLFNNGGHDTIVLLVEMAHGFVKEDKVERLAYCTNDADSLLLADRHLAHREVPSGRDAETLEQSFYLVVGDMSGKIVFQDYVVPGGEFGKESQILGEISERIASRLLPVLYLKLFNISIVEKDFSYVILSRPVDICAQRRFAGAAFGRNYVMFAFGESKLSEPDV